MKSSRITLFVAMALVGVAVYLGTRPEAGHWKRTATHFAIGDTSRDQDRIADAQGQVAVLERSKHPMGLWSSMAIPGKGDATDLLLQPSSASRSDSRCKPKPRGRQNDGGFGKRGHPPQWDRWRKALSWVDRLAGKGR